MTHSCMTVGFDSDANFLDAVTKLQYDQFSLEMRSGGRDRFHNVLVPTEASFAEAFRAASRFLSELCWFHGMRICDIASIHGTGRPQVGTRASLAHTNDLFVHDFRQAASSAEQHLALGFYREGYSSSSPFYRFLSFFKIINIQCSTGTEHQDWINSNLPKIQEAHVALDWLRRRGVGDVGRHLWEEGRNALAHADVQRNQPIVDTDDYDHWQRVVYGSALVKELATIFITQELGLLRGAA